MGTLVPNLGTQSSQMKKTGAEYDIGNEHCLIELSYPIEQLELALKEHPWPWPRPRTIMVDGWMLIHPDDVKNLANCP
jgi:hypothetical protein